MQISGHTIKQKPQPIQVFSFSKIAQWYPDLLNCFEEDIHCLGQNFMHKPHPLHFSELILIVAFITQNILCFLRD